MLIKNKNHDRDISSTIDKIQSELDAQLDYNVTDFLAGIRSDKPRYARDQFRLLQSLLDKYGKEKLINAAKFCTENRLFSANTARNFLKFSEFPKPEIRQIDNQWYDQSCLELLVYNNRLFIGIWFGKNNKEFMKLKSHEHDIIEKSKDYSGYTWVDENGTSAPTDEKLIQWLCESGHETAFRKELTDYSKDEVVAEMQHLKEYLDILL